MESQGPLEYLPKSNYSSMLTMSNYLLTKQMVDQVLNEDQEYVLWKMKNLRSGGTMQLYLPNRSKKRDRDSYAGESDAEFDEETEQQFSDTNGSKTNKKAHLDKRQDRINEVPKNMVFPKDIRDEQESSLQFPSELNEKEQFKLLVTNLDEDQTNRFEVFHRTSLNKTQIKKLSTTVINQSTSENVRVFLQAIGKIFVGEIIELAFHVRQKWLANVMQTNFNRRKVVGNRLKKFSKKLMNINESNNNYQDSVDEEESDEYYDDEKTKAKEIKEGNSLLRSNVEGTPEIKASLISHYNKLVKEFNLLDVSVEKYSTNSPLLPEHIREAWRLYQIQNETNLPSAWRNQGEANGWMFR